jgi:hypothetical protein
MLAQLRRVARAVREVYEPGVEFVVLTEGEIFSELLHPEEAKGEWRFYDAEVQCFAGTLKVPATFVSLQSLVDMEMRAFRERFLAAFHGTLPTIHHPLFGFFHEGQNTASPSPERAVRALRLYLSTKAAVHELGLVEKMFPEHIPLSPVALKSQLSLWWVEKGCSLLPHCGVPLMIRGGKKRIVPLLHKNGSPRRSARSLPKEAVPVFVSGLTTETSPFCYLLQ